MRGSIGKDQVVRLGEEESKVKPLKKYQEIV
jgi:hypothetical protein